jgi:hypothetical protein
LIPRRNTSEKSITQNYRLNQEANSVGNAPSGYITQMGADGVMLLRDPNNLVEGIQVFVANR